MQAVEARRASTASIRASPFMFRGSNGPLGVVLRAAVIARTSIRSISPSPSTSPARGIVKTHDVRIVIAGLVGELRAYVHHVVLGQRALRVPESRLTMM